MKGAKRAEVGDGSERTAPLKGEGYGHSPNGHTCDDHHHQGESSRLDPPSSSARLAATVKCKIIRPLGDVSWEQIGPHMHALVDLSRRVMNRASDEMRLNLKTKQGATQTIAYQAVGHQLADERAYAATQSKRTKRATIVQDIDVSGGMRAAWSNAAAQRFQTDLKAVMRGEKSSASYRRGIIMIRGQEWELLKDSKGYVVSCKLHGGRNDWVSFAISADGGSVHAHLRKMMDGSCGAKPGDLKIAWDERKRCWYALMSYTFNRPERTSDPNRMMAVRRGMSSMITYACDDRVRSVSGSDVIAFKQKLDARRRDIGRHLRKGELGRGARGHGEKRRFWSITKLDGLERNFVRTKCQQVAAAVVKEASQRGAGSMVIEDFGTPVDATADAKYWLLKRWPWATLKEAISWACAKAGLDLYEVSTVALKRRCPGCAHELAGDPGDVFTCPSCELQRSTEQVVAMNMLADMGDIESVRKMERSRKKTLRTLHGENKESGQ